MSLQQSLLLRKSILVWFLASGALVGIHAFSFPRMPRMPKSTRTGSSLSICTLLPHHTREEVTTTSYPNTFLKTSCLFSTTDAESTTTTSAEDKTQADPDPPSTMRIKEIKAELTSSHVLFTDCFDKESLVQRLVEARSDTVPEQFQKASPSPAAESQASQTTTTATSSPSSSSTTTATTTTIDKEEIMTNLRSLKVRELRTRCAQANIRWAHMIEKEELVQALLKHQLEVGSFSASGKLIPSQVADIDEITLEQELKGGLSTPLVLDVYATWCGPCKMMAPQLEQAAEELQSTVRVAKMDSDQNPSMSSKLQVNALPTVILFDGRTGKEIKRVEGALMKDALVELGQSGL